MYRIIVFALCINLWSITSYAQTHDQLDILNEIERNNNELKAMKEQNESLKLTLRSSNMLPDPEADVFWLPSLNNSESEYYEFQLSQSFEFPTVYMARSQRVKLEAEQLDLLYTQKRQEILLEAQLYLVELATLEKRDTLEQNRLRQAQTVYQQAKAKLEREEISLLEFNKAKLSWLQMQFVSDQIQAEKQNLLLQLNALNGGIKLSSSNYTLPVVLMLPSPDSLWQQKLNSDPALVLLAQQEAMAKSQLKLARNQNLPNLKLGYNQQVTNFPNTDNDAYAGVYGGISIPIWSRKGKVKAANYHLNYSQVHKKSQTELAYAEFRNQLNNYQVLLGKYNEYQQTLKGLESEELLLKTYQLGDISFTEYYIEQQFYKSMYDTLLNIEKQLYQLQAKLLKHQL